MTAEQLTLPGLETDRHHYAWTRIRSLTDQLNAHERKPIYWTHDWTSCECDACTWFRSARQELAELTREVNARTARQRDPERGPTVTPRTGRTPRVSFHNPQDREWDPAVIGESGSRPADPDPRLA